MSEPIQSIAQNNYILATQQEVSHDNTLSGNGTVDSPLGVVPGYNETVLWEATANNQYSATLNEPYSNFERIRIEFGAADTLNTGRTLYNEFPGYASQFNLIGQRTDAGGVVMTVSDLSGTNNSTYLVPSYGRFIVVPKTSTSLSVGNISVALKSVVGINRIANN